MVGVDEYVRSVSRLMNVEDLDYVNNERLHERFAGRSDCETPCGAGFRKLAIDRRGNILPCIVMNEFVGGNVLQDDLLDVFLNSSSFRHFRDASVDKIPECARCRHKSVCRGGCRARAYQVSGALMSPDIVHCKLFDALFDGGCEETSPTEAHIE
jgi:radical SAM protein with 4Fe4S-binding SPASM domain